MKLIPLSLAALALASAASAQNFSKMGEIPQFLAPVSYPVAGATLAVLADVNGDGIPDIITANGFSGNTFVSSGQGISVLLGNGDGSFQPAHNTLATGNPISVVVGEFNKDGRPDIIAAYGPGVPTLSILHGNGDGTFQAPATIPIGYFAKVAAAENLGVSSLVAADFNGDGKLDLALASGSIILISLASISPVAVLGTFDGNAGTGTLKLSGPAADGVVVQLVSANPALLTVPSSVAVAPGATTATFPITAGHVAADTVVNLTGTLGTTTRSGAVMVKKQPATVVVQKAEYVVKKGQLTVQATSTNLASFPGELVPSLRVYNASSGTLIAFIRVAGINKGVGTLTGVLNVTGSLTSIAVQDSGGGVAIAAVTQK